MRIDEVSSHPDFTLGPRPPPEPKTPGKHGQIVPDVLVEDSEKREVDLTVERDGYTWLYSDFKKMTAVSTEEIKKKFNQEFKFKYSN